MKTLTALAALVCLSGNAQALPRNIADLIGPKLDSSAKLTAKCVLEYGRSEITVFEYKDSKRNEVGASIIDVGVSSAVEDSITRITSPDATWKDALLARLTDQDAYGMSQEEASAELKNVRCKKL